MTQQWYWDLEHGRAVPEHERGPDANTLGPYPSRFHAEHWKELAEQRNQAWDEDDEEWERWNDPETGENS